MTNHHSTLPAPPAHTCGSCRKTYNAADLARVCAFIGRGDAEEDGDRRLAYYNCRCNSPGTFVVNEVPPAVEPLANLRSIFEYRKALLDASPRGEKFSQELFQYWLQTCLAAAVEAGRQLLWREEPTRAMAIHAELEKMTQQKASVDESLRRSAAVRAL